MGVGADFVLYTWNAYFVKIHCATLHFFHFAIYICYNVLKCLLKIIHVCSSPSKITIQVLWGRWGPVTDYFKKLPRGF